MTSWADATWVVQLTLGIIVLTVVVLVFLDKRDEEE